MEIKIIEATSNNFNFGKFMLMRFTEEWNYSSLVSPPFPLLSVCGWGREHLGVFDLQTGEGGIFMPRRHADPHHDLNEKHKIWVCLLFEPFLEWLYQQDAVYEDDGLKKLPDVVDLPNAENGLYGYRREGKKVLRDMDKPLALAAFHQILEKMLDRKIPIGEWPESEFEDDYTMIFKGLIRFHFDRDKQEIIISQAKKEKK